VQLLVETVETVVTVVSFTVVSATGLYKWGRKFIPSCENVGYLINAPKDCAMYKQPSE
jgi:hypothetical protein